MTELKMAEITVPAVLSNLVLPESLDGIFKCKHCHKIISGSVIKKKKNELMNLCIIQP